MLCPLMLGERANVYSTPLQTPCRGMSKDGTTRAESEGAVHPYGHGAHVDEAWVRSRACRANERGRVAVRSGDAALERLASGRGVHMTPIGGSLSV